MKVKTSELTGADLDRAVAEAEGISVVISGAGKYQKVCYIPKGKRSYYTYTPSTNWKQGGPIIEREEIGVRRNAPCSAGREWEATPSILAKGAGGRWGYGPHPTRCCNALLRRFADGRGSRRAGVRPRGEVRTKYRPRA